MSKRIREMLALLEKSGAQQIEFNGKTQGQHLSFDVRAPNGKRQTFFMSGTPSCCRGDLNKLSKVRQFCRINQD